ncbi:MAG: penicillin-binding protein [Bacilli bacterium]|nr:penicillin-binding protein [Bacilli bacterium]
MKNRATVKTYGIVIITVAFLFCAAIWKLAYVVLNDEVDGVNLKSKSASITTASRTLYASRGSIFDANGDKLATTVNSYTLIAYLSKTRTTNEKNPQHVVDKEYTAECLAPILGMEESKILEYLNKENVYQTQFGSKGMGLTERTKKQIEALELPGIDFIQGTKRYYDKSSFASYIVGYAKTDEKTGEINGELGIERYFNDTLAGTNGSTTYQKYTSSNYQIPNTDSFTEPAKDGADIYLTIDSKIQRIAESAVALYEQYNVDWALFTVMDANTGAIVASATNPGYDPNDTNTIKSYMNPLVSYQYEPGSVMKIFSWASAIEEGEYDGEETYDSGSIALDGDITIRDSNRSGWGNISFDTGFAYSSNVAATKLALRLGVSKLHDYYDRLGFGKQTGIELANEVFGDIDITYQAELATASFGQGISVTAIQMLQALSSMTNDGNVIKPYVVQKIVNSDGTVTHEGKRTVVNNVYSPKTVEKMHELMHNMVYAGLSTMWQVPNVNIMGKTGTAQIAGANGKYSDDEYDYVKSFAGIFPADNPKYIVYVAAQRVHGTSRQFSEPITTAIEEIASYAKVTENATVVEDTNLVDITNYISKEISSVTAMLENKKISLMTIGNGKYVVDQYPTKDSTLLAGGKLFLLTNSEEIIMPNMIGWSRSEVKTYCNLVGIDFELNGYGYVVNQSIPPDTMLTKEMVLTADLA